MNFAINSSIGCILFVLFLVSCDTNLEPTKPVKWTKENSAKLGETLLFEQEIDIKLYLKRRPDWNIQETGTGLRYWIYEEGQGETPLEGQTVSIDLEVRLLDDSLCYKSEANDPYEFVVDKSDIESGIQEGIKYLNKGAKAKLIFPSHLGHGLVGDLDKIPPLQALVVDIHLKDIR